MLTESLILAKLWIGGQMYQLLSARVSVQTLTEPALDSECRTLSGRLGKLELLLLPDYVSGIRPTLATGYRVHLSRGFITTEG